MRLSVLGGSTPFAAGLFNSIEKSNELIGVNDLILFGRNHDNMNLIAEYARNRLENRQWRVYRTDVIREALENVDIVLHQIRYGDLEGRKADEDFSRQWGILPDETLGPAAFHGMLRQLSGIRKTVNAIRKYCPEAWIINLTNPLSLVTFFMQKWGVKRCVGVCELPLMTAKGAAEALGMTWQRVEWWYSGLNHRGFVTHLLYDGKNWVDDYLLNAAQDFSNIPREVMEALGGIPTKYFRIHFSSGIQATRGDGSRALFLMDLRKKILAELQQDCCTIPKSLSLRQMDWYEMSVVPLIKALSVETPTRHVVNALSVSGVVDETVVKISKRGMTRLHTPTPSKGVHQWQQRFRAHELAMIYALQNPTRQTFEHAMACDPMVSEAQITGIADALFSQMPLL